MNKRNIFQILSCLSLRQALLCVAATQVVVAAQAQAQAAKLEEIIVTAERRAQDSQDVPLAVSTFSGQMVSPAGMTGLFDIALKTPNLTFTEFNLSEPQLYLRGIGSTSDSAGADPTVSLFIDGVYIGRSAGGSTDLYDLDRIEVLRGPQGTLYGRNVTGGAISLFTKKPSHEFESKVGVTVGDYDLTVFRAYVNGPLTNNLAGKFTLSKRDLKGYSKNVTNGQNLDDADNLSGRGQLLWNQSDNTEVLVGFDFSRDAPNGGCRNRAKLDVPLSGGHRFDGAFVSYLQGVVADLGIEDPRTCAQTIEEHAEKDIFGTLLNVQHDFSDMQLTSITAYREADYHWVQELNGMDAPPALLSVEDFETEKSDQVSQEFRLTRETDNLFWVVGAFGIRENVERFVDSPLVFSDVSPVNTGVTLERIYKQDAENTSYALYGQFTWSFTDSLALTAGGRQTWDNKKMNQSHTVNGADIYDLKGLEKSWNQFTPRVTLDWKLSEDKMLYFTWSKGYKSGIFLSQNSSAVAAASTLEPEDATNYEVGAKTEWFDNRLRFNISYFDLEVEDLQLFRLIFIGLVSENANIKSTGIESDFALAVTDRFFITGMYSQLDAKFVGGTFDGKSATHAPEQKANLTANYQLPLSDSGASLAFDIGVTYSDKFFTEEVNTLVSLQDGYTTWDASTKFTSANGRWDVTLWGKNLSDELITLHGLVSFGAGSVELYAPPRTYGATFNYHFD